MVTKTRARECWRAGARDAFLESARSQAQARADRMACFLRRGKCSRRPPVCQGGSQVGAWSVAVVGARLGSPEPEKPEKGPHWSATPLADGRKGYSFTGTATLGRLLAGETAAFTRRGGPNGIRTRVSATTTFSPYLSTASALPLPETSDATKTRSPTK